MKFFHLISLFLLISVASVSHAAEVTLMPEAAAAGQSFAIPVVLNVGSEKINVVEGLIRIPDGLTIDSVSTAGSALTLFANGPTYVVSDHAVTFTGGAPTPLSGPNHLLFTMHARAVSPGSYTLTPSGVFMYRANGTGARVSIATVESSVEVGLEGSVAPTKNRPESQVTPLIAELGRDASLFDGKYFVAFFGGDRGAGVNHYVVQEGWWRKAVRANQYYVLKDQQQGSSVHITAIDSHGRITSTTIPAAHPWTERLTLLAALLLLAFLCWWGLRFLKKV